MSARTTRPLSFKSRTFWVLLGLGLLMTIVCGSLRLNEEMHVQTERSETQMQLTLPPLYAEPLARDLAGAEARAVELDLQNMLQRQGVLAVDLLTRAGQHIHVGETGKLDDEGPHAEFRLRHPDDGSELGVVRVMGASPTWQDLLESAHLQRWLAQYLGLALAIGLVSLWLVERLLLQHLRRLASDIERFDVSQPPGQFAWALEPPAVPSELQQINRALNHVQQNVEEQLHKEQERVRVLREQLDQHQRALQDAEAALAVKQRELALLQRKDRLTGLANRREFDDALRREFKRAQRQQSGLALAVLDLDHLKAYNEVHGHEAGDHLLQRFAQLLADRFKRDTDVVARLGGEEFGALLPDFDMGSAQGMLDQLREDWRALALPHGASPGGEVVTVSIGLAAYNGSHRYLSPSALMQAADEALYIAKHAGRDRLSLAA